MSLRQAVLYTLQTARYERGPMSRVLPTLEDYADQLVDFIMQQPSIALSGELEQRILAVATREPVTPDRYADLMAAVRREIATQTESLRAEIDRLRLALSSGDA